MKKKIFALLTAFLTCATLGVVSACKNKNSGSGGGNGLTGDELMYTVSVKSEGGMRMAGVTVCATDADGNVVKESKVGANGKATFYLDDGEYGLKLKDIPLGFYQTSFGQKISEEAPDASITLGIELVEEEDRAGHIYRVGDVMHDFTITTFDGEELTLSEMLEEKDMVFLNFWYTTCSPCLTEMPWMNNSYNDDRYAGQFELIAVHNSTMATMQETKTFLSKTNWNFKFSHEDMTDISKYFLIGGYPTTVIIDRFGVVTLCETGRLENQNECNDLIAKHLGSGYRQNFAYGGVEDVGEDGKEQIEVTEAQPSNDAINAALGTSGLTYSPDANKYVWPFIVKEVDGRECLMASNGPTLGVDAHGTSAALNVKVNVPELADYTDYVFTFDYKISSEYQADYLYVLVDGVIVQKYSGPDMIPNENGNLYVPSEWQTSYAYVPVKSGEHTLSFVYAKDGGTSDGEDTVYIDNLRFAPLGEGETYVYRNAATGRNNDNDGFKDEGQEKDTAPRFDEYIDVYYNEKDTCYHVHNENGPLLLANLMDTSSNWSKYPLWNYLAVGDYLEYTDGNEVVNLKPFVEEFANAENHSTNGYVPVTQELKELLEYITNIFGSGYENEWLEFCCYYDAYNCEEMKNPCAGVNFKFAIEIPTANLTNVGDEVRATVDIQTLLKPRGYKYSFTPTVSGVYQFESDRSISKAPDELSPMAWFTQGITYDNEGYVQFLHEAVGSLYSVDFDFIWRLEAGKTYYIAAADQDPNKLGDQYEIVITFCGADAAKQFTECATLPYVSILDSNGVSIGEEARGIRWGVDTDGYVKVRRNDGSFGSNIYLDMLGITHFFSSSETKPSLKDIIEGGALVASNVKAFDFSDLKIDTNRDEILDTPVLDPTTGKPYGNYLEKMKAYLAEAMATTGELHGYVKVTKELQLILDLFTQQVYGDITRESWQTMCYYYREV